MKGSPVSICVQDNLADDGNRSSDEGIRLGLDSEYPGWKSPDKTYMVPDFFKLNQNNKGSSAENVVYNCLKQLGARNKEPMFVCYSVNYSEHIPGCERKKSWVMGEMDFAIIHKNHGPIFIEVKATDSHGAARSFKDAEEQLRKHKLFVEKRFQDSVEGFESTRKVTQTFANFPAFVAMPNCPRPRPSVYVQGNALYQDDCSSLESFSKWWNSNVSSAEHPPVDPKMFEKLVMWFVGMYYLTPACNVGLRVNRDDKEMLFCTKRQMEILAGHDPPKQWIRGPAGSGKSYLLILKASTLAAKILNEKTNDKILVLCFNSVLRKELENRIKHRLLPVEDVSSFLHFMTFAKLVMGLAGLDRAPESKKEKEKSVNLALKNLKENPCATYYTYDHIFVDEGQDLYGTKWPELLHLMHNKSNDPNGKYLTKSGFFWVMYDMNQYLYFAKEHANAHFANLSNSSQLNKVFRNTGHVFVQSKKYFQSLMPNDTPIMLGHKVDGLPVSWDDSLVSRSEAEGEGPQKIVEWIKKLERENVSPRDICILVETKEKQKPLRDAILRMGVESQTGDDWVEKSDGVVVVESIRRFKGLERKVVILYNPPFQDNPNVCIRELLYTAVSRCSCYLVVITTTEGCEALKSDAGVYT